MTAFMEEYEKVKAPHVGIPSVVMNEPVVAINGLGEIGLEFEIEGENLPSSGKLARVVGKTTGSQWTSKSDGSLRGESLEYVLSRPCNIDEVETMVEGLYKAFVDNGTELKLSNRCSTHVHVNMAGARVNDITSAIALWTAFEEPLTLWAGEERVNNHFCLGAKDCNAGTVSAWRSFLRSGRRDFNDNLKYSALNILTLYRFGSLEYRVMNGTEDAQRAIDWTKFVHSLTRYASDRFANPATMAYSMSEKGGREIFMEICEKAGVSPDFVTGVIDTVPDINTAVMRGFRRAQPIVAGFPWHDWYEECKKKYIADPFGSKKKKSKMSLDPFIDWVEDFAEVRPAPLAPRPIQFDRAGRVAGFGNPVAEVDVARPDAPGEPDRPRIVPRNYRWDGEYWCNPDYDPEAFNINLPDAQVEYTMYQTAMSISAGVVNSNGLHFYDNTSMRVARAVIVKIDRRGTVIQVRADKRLMAGVTDLSRAWWYNISDGRFNGDDIAFIH